MNATAGSGTTPWKWDTTLLHREEWKCDSPHVGDLWKLADGTIVVRIGGIWDGGFFRDEFVQKCEELTLCSTDNGISWTDYSGPELHNALEFSDGTLIEGVHTADVPARQEEMKELVKKALGLTDEDLTQCQCNAELWPASEREALGKKGYSVKDVKGMPGVVGTHVDQGMSFRGSFDGGKTWEVKRIEGLPPFASLGLHAKGHALPDDTALLPSYGREKKGDPDGSFVLRSTDRGESWQICTIAADATGAHGYNETHLLQLPDGRLLAMMRHYGPGADGLADRFSTDTYIFQNCSEDGGLTWSEPEGTPIWGFPLTVLTLQSGKLMCTYAHRRRPFGIRACLSRDLGKTWDIDNEIIIRDDARQGGPVGCGQSIQADDGTILTFYGIAKIGRIKPKSPHRWYPDDVHPFVGLSRFTENYVRARGQSQPPKEREEVAAQSENILDNPPERKGR